MKVLGFIRDSNWDMIGPVHYYRTYLPLREVGLRAKGIGTSVLGKGSLAGVPDNELGGNDVYTMARMFKSESGPALDWVHRNGAVLVLDSDDDLTEEFKLVSGVGDEFKEALGAVDYVTCSTPVLTERFAQYTQRPPVVLRNCVDVDWLQEVASGGKRLVERLVIGFSGSATHWGDWRMPSVPFARIGKDFPDVVLGLHGKYPRYLKYADEKATVLTLEATKFFKYPYFLSQFDIVLCAVDTRDQFAAGKSALKALECMALGVVPICSRFPPYLELAEQGAPIVLIPEDTRDGWYETMRALVQPDGYREHLSSLGPDWVREHRDMPTTGYQQWEAFYHEIVDGAC